MKKIIFILIPSPTLSIEENFYFRELIDQKIEIEVWDITSTIYENVSISDEINRSYIKKITQKKAFHLLLSKVNLKQTVFVMGVTYNYQSLWLYRALTKSNCIVCFFDRGNLPRLEKEKKEKIKSIIKVLDFGRIFQYVKNRFAVYCKRNGSIKNFNFVFAAGSKAQSRYGKSSTKISINSSDYDNYLTLNREKTKQFSEKYCVFLDEFLPYHPDFPILGIQTVNPKTYFQNLNRFFDFIEQKSGTKVIVAAHPKADYANNGYGRSNFPASHPG